MEWNNNKDNKTISVFLAQVVEPQLNAVKELTTEMALIKASLQHLRDEQGKLVKYVLEGNGRPSLTERTSLIEDKLNKVEALLRESEAQFDLLSGRVGEIREQTGVIAQSHEGHSNKMKLIIGASISIFCVLVPLIWNSTPHIIKWIELQKYNMRLYDQYIQQTHDNKR
jgi:hypothetical protein